MAPVSMARASMVRVSSVASAFGRTAPIELDWNLAICDPAPVAANQMTKSFRRSFTILTLVVAAAPLQAATLFSGGRRGHGG